MYNECEDEILNEYGLFSKDDIYSKLDKALNDFDSFADYSITPTGEFKPVFQLKDLYGCTSIELLVKSLKSAKSMYSKTNDPRYKKVIKVIKDRINDVNNKESNVVLYHNNDLLTKEMLAKSSDNINESLDLTSFIKRYAIINSILVAIKMLTIYAVKLNVQSKAGSLNTDYTNLLRSITNDKNILVYNLIPSSKKDIDVYSFDPTNSIYITPYISKVLNQREVTSILLHEYSHFRHKDSARLNNKSTFRYFMYSAFISLFVSTISNPALRTYAVIAQFILTFSLSVPSKKFYHDAEYIADSEAAKYGYGKDLISALKKLNLVVIKTINDNKENICSSLGITNKKECDQCISGRMDDVRKESYTHPSEKDREEAILRNPLIKKTAKVMNVLSIKNKLIFLQSIKKRFHKNDNSNQSN